MDAMITTSYSVRLAALARSMSTSAKFASNASSCVFTNDSAETSRGRTS